MFFFQKTGLEQTIFFCCSIFECDNNVINTDCRKKNEKVMKTINKNKTFLRNFF